MHPYHANTDTLTFINGDTGVLINGYTISTVSGIYPCDVPDNAQFALLPASAPNVNTLYYWTWTQDTSSDPVGIYVFQVKITDITLIAVKTRLVVKRSLSMTTFDANTAQSIASITVVFPAQPGHIVADVTNLCANQPPPSGVLCPVGKPAAPSKPPSLTGTVH